MGNKEFYSQHLYAEPERLSLFRNVRHRIDKTQGSLTLTLQAQWEANELGELHYGPAKYSQAKRSEAQSDYLILIGMETYRLHYGPNKIGRFDDNDIVVVDQYVSRRHCCIVVHSDGRAELFDTASKNHTYVNNVRIERHWLKSGDEIRLASSFPLMVSLVG